MLPSEKTVANPRDAPPGVADYPDEEGKLQFEAMKDFSKEEQRVLGAPLGEMIAIHEAQKGPSRQMV